jgi:uncharacterized Fe-S cluster-containing protein
VEKGRKQNFEMALARKVLKCGSGKYPKVLDTAYGLFDIDVTGPKYKGAREKIARAKELMALKDDQEL